MVCEGKQYRIVLHVWLTRHRDVKRKQLWSVMSHDISQLGTVISNSMYTYLGLRQ